MVTMRHYLLRLTAPRDEVSAAHPVPSVEFQDAAQAWWEAEAKAEGLLLNGDLEIATSGPSGGMLTVTGEVSRMVAGPGSQERCGRSFAHAAHSWAKLCRNEQQRWSERRECPGKS